jgi:hypothetical protein
MTPLERKALAAVDLDWARHPDDIWLTPAFHVAELHREVVDDITQTVSSAAGTRIASPLGVVVLGERGFGKTHLMGTIRDRVQPQGTYFFLIHIGDGSTFWESAALCIVNGLLCPAPGGQTQLKVFLNRLANEAGVPMALHHILTREEPLTPEHLNQFAAEIKRLNRAVGQECRDTARALVLYGSGDPSLQDIGYDYLLSMNEIEPADRAHWGIRPGIKPPQRVVSEISRLLALTGPSVVAVDQFDTLLARDVITANGKPDPETLRVVNQIADGLMSLREVTRRTVTVVSCLPGSWILIEDNAVSSVLDRFRAVTRLRVIGESKIAQDIVARRLGIGYAKVGFKPPYPTWPIRKQAFTDKVHATPRDLLQAVDAHIRRCLNDDVAHELDALIADRQSPPTLPSSQPEGLAELDARFAELRQTVSAADAMTAEHEDSLMPALLAAGLAAWADEHRDQPGFEADPVPHGKPTLHGRIRRVLNETTGEEAHWSFRAIASTQPVAALSRLRNASILAGVAERMPARRLIVLRNTKWSLGAETQKALAALAAAGGVTLPVDQEDLITFAVLKQMREEAHPAWATWLNERKHATNTKLLSAALASALEAPSPTTPPEPLPTPRAWIHPLTLGKTVEDSKPAIVELESLRRHTAIFAGSGSGKTVLIRRIVEECALQGVSSIVLDPNNDLARLGDPWPEPPAGWANEDAVRAKRYLTNTEVVIWTPRREAGRPLTFQPLPDFGSIIDDPDEFASAIDAAVASLAPRAKVDGNTTKATHGQAVLKEALKYYVRSGGSDLRGYLGVLRALPDGVSQLDKAEKIANEMAQTLTAETVIDPMFGGDGTPLDPGVLLTPPQDKRARVSVISLVGLQGDEQRQSFVNQLQMALFAWIKQHPAGDKPLGGLFVMDEAQSLAPSGAMTACTQSTLALASQARKYGLGLVFATQAPKALHNRIAGNATTQFFGLLNAPTQIDAAREMARAKGGDVPDISRLKAGQFYAAGEGLALTKIQAPNSLSYHPKSPLTTDEVVDRARRGTDSAGSQHHKREHANATR